LKLRLYKKKHLKSYQKFNSVHVLILKGGRNSGFRISCFIEHFDRFVQIEILLYFHQIAE